MERRSGVKMGESRATGFLHAGLQARKELERTEEGVWTFSRGRSTKRRAEAWEMSRAWR